MGSRVAATPTDEPERNSGGAHAVDALDEAAALRRDRLLAAEGDDAGAYRESAWMLGELVRRANARRKLDPQVANAIRLVAVAVDVSSTRLTEAVHAALAGEEPA